MELPDDQQPSKMEPAQPHCAVNRGTAPGKGLPLPQICLVLVALTWGASYVIVKDVLQHVSVPAYLTLRFLLALPIVLVGFHQPISAWVSGLRRTPAKVVPTLLAMCAPGLVLFLAFVLQTHGLRSTEPGIAAFLTSLVFLFVPLCEYMDGGGIPLRKIALPGLLAFIGSALLTRPWMPNGDYQAGKLSSHLGELLILISAIAYSLHIYLSGKLARKSHSSATFLVQGSVVLLCSAGWLLLVEPGALGLISLSDLLRIIFIAVVVTGGCYLLQFWAQRSVDSRYVGLIYTLEPVAALVVGGLTGRQALTLTIFSGAMLTTTAAILAALTSSVDPAQIKPTTTQPTEIV